MNARLRRLVAVVGIVLLSLYVAYEVVGILRRIPNQCMDVPTAARLVLLGFMAGILMWLGSYQMRRRGKARES